MFTSPRLARATRAKNPPFTRTAATLGVLSFLLAASGTSSAQSASGTLPQVDVVEEATSANGRLDLDTPAETGSRLGLTPRETPGSVTIVDRAAIDARGAQDTQEILRGVPGITAHNAPGNIGVSYRGFGTSSISQLFNGINVQYSIAARPVDSWIYDRVEVIGGPSSFLFGSGAVGGSINYITKLAQRADISEAQLRVGTENLVEGSVGLNRRIAGDGGAGSHYLRIDANHRDSNGWTDGTGSKSTQVATSLLSDFGGGFTHTLAYEYQKETVDRPYWGTPVLNPIAGTQRVDPGIRFKNYNSADGLYEQEVQWLRSIADWRINDALQLRNTFYAYDALRDYRNVETYRYNPTNTAVIRSGALLQRHDQDLVGDRLEGIYRGQLGGMRSDWSFGLDYSVNKQTRFPNSGTTTVSTVNPYFFTTGNFTQETGIPRIFVPDRDNEVTTTAVYVENRTALVPTVNLVTALRHERIDLDLTNRRAVTAANPASFSRSYEPTTGRIGVVWDVAPGANLYAQYATAADPPSGILTTASFSDVRNNSELTTGRQVEIGSKIDFWEKKGNATVALYDIQRQNIATQDPNNSALTVLVGEQSSRGVELAIGLQPTPQWSIQANAAYVDAQYDRFNQGGVSLAGKTPTNTPSTVANLWVSYAFTPTLEGSVGLRHVGKVYADAANTLTWPSYTLVDLALSWQVNKSVALIGRLRNATDKLYAANVASATQVYLGAPRTADVTLRVAF